MCKGKMCDRVEHSELCMVKNPPIGWNDAQIPPTTSLAELMDGPKRKWSLSC